MYKIETEGLDILSWCEDIEDSALQQAKNLAMLPFAERHIALMPDCHAGYGMPIGGVLAARDVIVPNAVGVDIGCGVIACKTTIKDISDGDIKRAMSIIRKKIPVGFNHHEEDQEWDGFYDAPDCYIVNKELGSARKQLGTLGGGNHFIEIQRGEDGCIWVMIHSGSRNIGLKIAKWYSELADAMCKKWHSAIPTFNKQDSLAFFPVSSSEGNEYLECMDFALYFASQNRRLMMDRCIESLIETDLEFATGEYLESVHNFAEFGWVNGDDCWVHRKGATSAFTDMIAIIPGSQGTASYIARGLGNCKSFFSCSHGAGRKMSRAKARAILSLEEEKKKLDDLGIIHAIRTQKDLDEAPSAYKDIDEVMAAQSDLVEVVEKLIPIAVIKG